MAVSFVNGHASSNLDIASSNLDIAEPRIWAIYYIEFKSRCYEIGSWETKERASNLL